MFCAKSIEKLADGSFKVIGESFPVTVLHASLAPDIGILARTDDIKFDRPIAMCDPTEVPWLADPDNWECRVKCYHCPVDIFKQTDMPLPSTNMTDYHSIAYHTTDRFCISEIFLGGSSGGAFVMEKGHKLLGVLVTTQVTSTDFVGVDYQAGDTSSSGTMEVSNPSVSFTTAVVPALLAIGREKLPIAMFLTQMGY